jgi:predicted Rossmann fold nucleotide-binding protein DprA/Smf involved in DNA uptake
MPISGSQRNSWEDKMEAKEYFGSNAGKVWNALSKGSKTVTQLQKSTGLSLKEVGIGLGWLAREGKIAAMNPGSVQTRFQLTE